MTAPTPDQTDYAAVHADIVTLLEAARRAAAGSLFTFLERPPQNPGN